jgi:hypothetical protein
MYIHRARTADIPKIKDLYEEAIAFQRSRGLPYWNALDLTVVEADIAAGALYLLSVDMHAVGIFSFCPPSPMDEDLWQGLQPHAARYINRIIVGRLWQGRSLFGLMLAWSERETLRLGFDRLRLDTWADNRRLGDYYSRFGFVHMGERTASSGPELSPQYRGVRLAIMEKLLAPPRNADPRAI